MTEAANSLSPEVVARRDRLLEVLRACQKVVVAFSGGIDSTVVAKAAHLALGDRATAVTADSASVPRAEIEDARRLAQQIGIAHRIVKTEEFESPDYLRNDGSRCYHCKSELYTRIESILPELGDPIVCSGANLDDQGDYRPGLTAASEHAVRHPLQEAGFTKAHVRELARSWDLPTWDKPASPCLSSRLAPGVPVTTERTARVEAAELYLRSLGFRECRVRLHQDELAPHRGPAGRAGQTHGARPVSGADHTVPRTGLSVRHARSRRVSFGQSQCPGKSGQAASLCERSRVGRRGRLAIMSATTPLAADQALERYFHEARSKLLDVAAILDRIDRGQGAPRPSRIRACKKSWTP